MKIKKLNSYSFSNHTERPLPTMFSSTDWNDWFAGLIDGDGYFYISKTNEVSVEITTHVTDERLLNHIKQKLGGSVKLRSGSNSIRYRVKKKDIVRDILQRLNGKLHNQNRINQFVRACTILDIIPMSPQHLLPTSPYLSGLIDSDGTITANVSSTSAELSIVAGVEGRIQRMIYSRGHNQVSLKIASVDKGNIEFLINTYKMGTIYEIRPEEKAKRVQIQYYWMVNTENEFIMLYHMLRGFPLKSVKMHRIRLLPIYFKYKQLKYHLSSPDSIQFKQWEKLCRLWYKYSY